MTHPPVSSFQFPVSDDEPLSPIAIAERAYRRHAALHSFTHYTGILTLHGLGRLARITGRTDLMNEARARLLPFVRGEHGDFPCNFPNYRCGGNATAYLLMTGELPEAAETVGRYADQILREAPRDPEGIVCLARQPALHKIWIDAAFAVTPFLLYTGIALGRPECVEEACAQTEKMVEALRDPANGLLHQARNFGAPGRITEDHWSRGNGWGLLALTELCAFLPPDHPRRSAIEQRFRDLVAACLRVRGPSGLWHQELTEPLSYVETSGSGLILYAIGVGLECGLLPADAREVFEGGLRAMLDYITPAGDVFHTCRGCLAPGEGRIVDYMARPPVRNDSHAFGPVVLAFGALGERALPAHDISTSGRAVSPKPPKPRRKKLPHDVPSWVSDDAIFFITLCCAKRGPNQLCVSPIAEGLGASLLHRQKLGDWWVHLALLMPDHLHGLFSFPPDRSIKKVLSSWKRFTARAYGITWQQDFFEHRLRAGESFVEKAQYIRLNPVRKGLALTPDAWPHVWGFDELGRARSPSAPGTAVSAKPPYPMP